MEHRVKIAGVVKESIVDGPGIRVAIFFQGCPHNCKGCHNPDTHDLNGGHWEEIETLAAMACQNPLITGVTLSGGDPFFQPEAMLALVNRLKETGKSIIAYTGWTIEELLEKGEPYREILSKIDFLIDGRFILEQRDLDLKFRGSKNQRVIDCKQTILQGKVVEHEF